MNHKQEEVTTSDLADLDAVIAEADVQLDRWQAIRSLRHAARDALTPLIGQPWSDAAASLERSLADTVADLRAAEADVQQWQQRIHDLRTFLAVEASLRPVEQPGAENGSERIAP
jgi:hypothetical protein